MPIIERAGLVAHSSAPSGPGVIPVEYSADIIQAATQASAALSTFNVIQMPTSQTSIPVLSALPGVGWVNETPLTGEGAEDTVKPTTSQSWSNVVLTAEELAAIVVIPEAVLEDASIDLWAQITPRLGEAIAMKVDETVFFGGAAGVSKPATFADGLYVQADDANQVAQTGDIVLDFNTAFGHVEASGFNVTNVYASTAVKPQFRGYQSTMNTPNYLSGFRDDGRADSIFGTPVTYGNRSWHKSLALGIVGDSQHAILGIRSDMQVKILSEATIDVSSAQDGSALVNLAQQDLVGMRVRFRFGFAVSNPVTTAGEDDGFPFAVVKAD